jgi:hypothetical protein
MRPGSEATARHNPVIYVVANLGVVLYYWREQRAHFNWILHFIFPVGTSVVLIYSR